MAINDLLYKKKNPFFRSINQSRKHPVQIRQTTATQCTSKSFGDQNV